MNYFTRPISLARYRSCIFICSTAIMWQWPVLYFYENMNTLRRYNGIFMPSGDQSSIIRFLSTHRGFLRHEIFRAQKVLSLISIAHVNYPFSICYAIWQKNKMVDKRKYIYHPQRINEHTIFIKQIYQMSLLFSSSLP